MKIVSVALLQATYIFLDAALLLLASRTIEGVTITESLGVLLLSGALLWAGEFSIKPVVKIISLPIIKFVFGFLRIVLIAFILGVVAYILPQLEIQTFSDLISLTLFVGLLGSIAKYGIHKIYTTKKN